MNRKTISALVWVLTLALTPLAAQEVRPSLADCFKTMPDRLIPATGEMRSDLLTYRESGLRPQVQGLDGVLLEIEAMTDTYLGLRTSERGTLQFKLLETASADKDSAAWLIAVVRTVQAPAGISSLRFYTLDWQLIEDRFPLPEVHTEDFWSLPMLDTICATSKPDSFDPESSVEISPSELFKADMYALTFSPDGPLLTATSSAGIQLGARRFAWVKEAFRGKLTFRWDGTAFVRE